MNVIAQVSTCAGNISIDICVYFVMLINLHRTVRVTGQLPCCLVQHRLTHLMFNCLAITLILLLTAVPAETICGNTSKLMA